MFKRHSRSSARPRSPGSYCNSHSYRPILCRQGQHNLKIRSILRLRQHVNASEDASTLNPQDAMPADPFPIDVLYRFVTAALHRQLIRIITNKSNIDYTRFARIICCVSGLRVLRIRSASIPVACTSFFALAAARCAVCPCKVSASSANVMLMNTLSAAAMTAGFNLYSIVSNVGKS